MRHTSTCTGHSNIYQNIVCLSFYHKIQSKYEYIFWGIYHFKNEELLVLCITLIIMTLSSVFIQVRKHSRNSNLAVICFGAINHSILALLSSFLVFMPYDRSSVFSLDHS